MTIQHTPGPWSSRGTLGPRHAEHLKGPSVVEIKANGAQLAVLSGWRTNTQIADARLMAAAPELLECLCEFVELVESTQVSSKTTEHVSLLNKAQDLLNQIGDEVEMRIQFDDYLNKR